MRRVLVALGVSACVTRPAGLPEERVTFEQAAAALEALSPPDARTQPGHTLELLEDAITKDLHPCVPPVDIVLGAPPGSAPERRIVAQQPHYDFFWGPISYRVGVDPKEGVWRVSLRMALEPSTFEGNVELPDCALRDALDGPVVCEGTPYHMDKGLDACPGSGTFEAPATARNLRLLLERWSRDVEHYWNRDAKLFKLPVRYDFDFVLHEGPALAPVDLTTPLWLTCGRTPYFMAFRSGWSLPIVAHEVGHYLGLLDEYQALSGITPVYPKAPFPGSERSRMGLSMKAYTRIYPLHHYLVLRRYHCADREEREPFGHVLDSTSR